MSEARNNLLDIPQDQHESPVTQGELDAAQASVLGDIVVSIARFREKGFHHAADAIEEIMWTRAAAEAKGE
jgi:hypothetical protein